MPPRSKVTTLPAEVKAWLDQSLVESNFSGYESLSAELAERGYSIGKSALHSYGQNFEERLSALKLASEQAKAVVAAAPDEEGAVNEALTRMVQEQLFNLLLAGEGKVDLPKVAKAVAELGRSSVTQKKWQAEHRKAIREEYAAEAAMAVTEELRGEDGMSEQLENRIRGILLGKA
uniref:Terminase n=1 Tax=viral metagenome TaxID=1070528 RepID=A0A6H1ZD06_9ZZZZ